MENETAYAAGGHCVAAGCPSGLPRCAVTDTGDHSQRLARLATVDFFLLERERIVLAVLPELSVHILEPVREHML